MKHVILAAALALCACAPASPPPSDLAEASRRAAPMTPEAITGRWLVTAIDGRPPQPVEGTANGPEPLSVAFAIHEPALDEGLTHLGGYGGCNMYWAPFSITDGRLVTDSIAATARACINAAGDQEARMLAIITSGAPIGFMADGALRFGPADAPLLLAVRDGPAFPLLADLEGEWRIAQAGGRRLEAGFEQDRPAGLRFSAAGEPPETGPRIAGYTGCNSFGGPIRLEGGRLTAGQLIQTQIGCGEVLGPQEEAILTAVSAGAPVTLTADGSLVIGPIDAPLLRATRP
jgi:heat shock protein HslJ